MEEGGSSSTRLETSTEGSSRWAIGGCCWWRSEAERHGEKQAQGGQRQLAGKGRDAGATPTVRSEVVGRGAVLPTETEGEGQFPDLEGAAHADAEEVHLPEDVGPRVDRRVVRIHAGVEGDPVGEPVVAADAPVQHPPADVGDRADRAIGHHRWLTGRDGGGAVLLA